MNAPLNLADPEVARAVQAQVDRQNSSLQMIASENYVSRAILEAQGSVLTNKYAEGYPGRRFYGGCRFVDQVEELAAARAKELFGADYANVQPHAGSQANMAIYFAHCCQLKDTILAMNLTHGGHLTHGSPASFSGRLYNFVFCGVSPGTETIDYDQVRDLARKHRPKLIVAGSSSYPRLIDFALFARIAAEVDAALMVDMAHISGLVAGGAHPSPVPHAQFVSSTTHKTLRGPRGGFILAQAGYGEKIDRQIFPGMQGGPLMHVIAAKAVAFLEAQSEHFATYASQIVKNSQILAQGLLRAGFKLVSGGSDNHITLINLTDRNLSGRQAEEALDEAGITANKNPIPFDDKPPTITSGLRLGTPALTTRGFTEIEMALVADLIAQVLADPTSESVKRKVRGAVDELCQAFPVPLNVMET